MPRLHPRLFRIARSTDQLLPLTLRATRDLTSAKNELRWLKGHAIAKLKHNWRRELRRLCIERSHGKPLQYILGTEFFGALELLCEPGVLIPRWETAQSITHLVHLLTTEPTHVPSHLRVLDLCTGTGCIPLLFRHEFRSAKPAPPSSTCTAASTRTCTSNTTRLVCTGVDISPHAISLADRNLAHVDAQPKPRFAPDSGTDVQTDTILFARADVFSPSFLQDIRTQIQDQIIRCPSKKGLLHKTFSTAQTSTGEKVSFDILICNPPYISPSSFRQTTSFSVRRHEPRLALVPESRHVVSGVDQGDTFYPRLLEIADEVGAKVILFEVGDLEQGLRVAQMVQHRRAEWEGIELWRDEPAEDNMEEVEGGVVIRGSGHGRSVFAYRNEGAQWVGR